MSEKPDPAALIARFREAAVLEDGHAEHGSAESHAKAKAEYDAAEAALLSALQPQGPTTQWRCFHCDETFTDKKLAAEHFGASEVEEPGCKMLAKGEVELLRDYRDMAARWQRCVSEDCDASRIFHSMSAKIATAERDAEQKGYDRGLADGRAEKAPSPTADDEAVLWQHERIVRMLKDAHDNPNMSYDKNGLAEEYEQTRAAVLSRMSGQGWRDIVWVVIGRNDKEVKRVFLDRKQAEQYCDNTGAHFYLGRPLAAAPTEVK